MKSSTTAPIDEGCFVPIHGLEQWVTVRGRRARNPALLIVPGPGAGMCVRAPFFAPWEQHFTLIQWDQPRAGVTAARHGRGVPADYSLQRLARDGLAVAHWACERLRVPRLALLGLSGGTIVGLNMVKRCPQRFSAYVGSGQIVNWARQDTLSFARVLGEARAAGDAAAIAELERIGAPPYPDTATDAIKAHYSVALSRGESDALATLDPALSEVLTNPPASARYVPRGLALERDVRAVATAAYEAVRAEILGFDAEALGLDFAVPMLFLQGELDACAVSSEVAAYAAQVRAPWRAYISITGGGHSPWLMRERFLALLLEHLWPLATASTERDRNG
ncbi:MAG TPA: alpha/beta hydrolase [Steroidobacteraceae bacterium]|nr:alpha/beta hydrolase [Steroidobacteraceae bacterium]